MKKSIIALGIVSFLLVSAVALIGIQTWRLQRALETQASRLEALGSRDEQLLTDVKNLEQELGEQIQLIEDELANRGSVQDALKESLSQGMESIQEMYFDLLKKNDGLESVWRANIPGKVAYLTFDDGPSIHTESVLNTLKKEKIKATFFVNGRPGNDELYRRINLEGHTMGMHGYSHDYEAIYASVEAFVADFDKLDAYLGDLKLNFKPLYRFPGGAKNGYALRLGGPDLTARISAAMADRGYYFYEWNVSGEDAESKPDGSMATAKEITAAVLKQARYKRVAVILLHDGPGHAEVAKALPGIIKGLRTFGYTFRSLP